MAGSPSGRLDRELLRSRSRGRALALAGATTAPGVSVARLRRMPPLVVPRSSAAEMAGLACRAVGPHPWSTIISAKLKGTAVLQLWRGEPRARRNEIRINGLRCKAPPFAPGWPTLSQLRFAGLEPALIATLDARALLRHVGTGSDGSDYISFASRSGVATCYARGSTGRAAGLLVGFQFHSKAAFLWQTSAGVGRDAFMDDRGRMLLSVAGLIFPTHHEWTATSTTNRVRGLGRRDAEYLVHGKIDPGELTLLDV
jgi:hypothetical protein